MQNARLEALNVRNAASLPPEPPVALAKTRVIEAAAGLVVLAAALFLLPDVWGKLAAGIAGPGFLILCTQLFHKDVESVRDRINGALREAFAGASGDSTSIDRQTRENGIRELTRISRLTERTRASWKGFSIHLQNLGALAILPALVVVTGFAVVEFLTQGNPAERLTAGIAGGADLLLYAGILVCDAIAQARNNLVAADGIGPEQEEVDIALTASFEFDAVREQSLLDAAFRKKK
jgi:hypothetical protein